MEKSDVHVRIHSQFEVLSHRLLAGSDGMRDGSDGADAVATNAQQFSAHIRVKIQL